MRFKSQLFALVLSVLVPAFLAAMLAIGYVYYEEQGRQETGMREAARTFSLLVDRELQARQRILRTIGNSSSLSGGQIGKFYEFAAKNAAAPDTAILLIGADGRQLLDTRVPFGSDLPGERWPGIERLTQRLPHEPAQATDVFVQPSSGQGEFIIQVPVLEGGELRYVVAMAVRNSAMQNLLSQENLPASWLGAIVDRNGRLLARSREPEKYVGHSADERLQRLFSSTREGVTRTVTLDGVSVKTFYHWVEASDWTVVLSIPEGEIRRSAIQGAGLFAMAAVLLLVAALVVARRIGVGVMSRMRQLEVAADALGRGEAVRYPPQGLVEVDAVGRRIAEASERLLSNQRELELRVSQAVADTERAQKALLQAQKMEALGRLTGGIAHEFNNLLQTLATSLHLAKRSTDPERIRASLDTCTKALKRAKVLTGQLSSFGRTQDARLETVSLQEHIHEFRQLVDNVLPASVNLDIAVHGDVWPVRIDPTQFELAFLNLIINAKDAMPAGGNIRVEVANEHMPAGAAGVQAGDYVRVSVHDSGVGMTAEVMAKALDPFFTTKQVGEGTGLGLPQAFGFARQSGGNLVLHSREGQGTQVDIYLPRSASAATSAPAVQADAPLPAGTARGTLLFVEDDALVRESVAPVLEGSGFFVIRAESADAALACLEAGTKVDVVFSDVVMPGTLNGIDLARTVITRFPHIRIVLATGYSENRVSMPGVQVLGKPYDVAEVLRILEASVAR